MSYSLSQKSLDRLKGVHPDLVRLAKEAIKVSPVDFGITQGVRTLEEQKKLYAQGRTEPGQIVTWTMDSKHLPQEDGYGHAFDVGCYVNGKLTWDEHYYETLSQCMLAVAESLGIKVKWGGSWKKPDKPHYQLDKT